MRNLLGESDGSLISFDGVLYRTTGAAHCFIHVEGLGSPWVVYKAMFHIGLYITMNTD